MAETTLERRLVALAADVDFPRVDVATAVAARVDEAPAPRRAPLVPLPRSRTLRRAVLIAIAAVLLLGAAALAGRLGVPGLKVIFEPGSRPTRAPVGRNLFLGDRTTFTEANGRLRFPIVTPHGRDLGPATVYVGREPLGGRISLVYRARPGLPRSVFTRAGLLITEFDASLEPSFLKKLTYSGVVMRSVDVNGDHGLWFSGEPHVLVYENRIGSEFEDSERLAGNTLVWSRGDVTIRLECNCDLHTALTIARSMR